MSGAALTGSHWTDDARRIARLAWPVLVGQLSVLAFSTIDTLLVARASATDLAALAIGAAAYITIFIGGMGVLMGLSPIVGQLYGAGRHQDAGRQMHQAVWVALGLALLSCVFLLFPQPFLMLSRASPEVAEKIRGYLLALAFSLPASLLFTVYRAFNTAVSRPKAVMALQLGGLAIKLPLSTLLVFGWPALGIPALGAVCCGIATAVAMWTQALLAWRVLKKDAFYADFALFGRGLDRPDKAALRQLLRQGVPTGASLLIEVTGFVFMAIFIARLGTTAVAGHQIVANLVALLFMVPLALASASGTLVAQHIGAGQAVEARRIGWHGLLIGTGLAAVMGLMVFAARRPVLQLYTSDAAVIAAAFPLVAWLGVFHIADAAQTLAAFVLRAYKVATVPVVVYATALWGVGLAGGYVLAFDLSGSVPTSLQGAPGFWMASTSGLVLAATALSAFMAWMFRQHRLEAAAAH